MYTDLLGEVSSALDDHYSPFIKGSNFGNGLYTPPFLHSAYTHGVKSIARSFVFTDLFDVDVQQLDMVSGLFMAEVQLHRAQVMCDLSRSFGRGTLRSDAFNKSLNGEYSGLLKSLVDRTIARNTPSWERIISDALNDAYQFGRASGIRRVSGNSDPLVYKSVAEDACDWCRKLYEKSRSAPKIFHLDTMTRFGVNNLGRRMFHPGNTEIHPVIGSAHSWCRCTIQRAQTNTQIFLGVNLDEI